MFDKLRQGQKLLQMRGEMKKLQRDLSQITETVELGEVKVKVSADLKVVYIQKSGQDEPEITEAINRAFKEVQKKAAKKMLEEKGLSGLLGGLGGA